MVRADESRCEAWVDVTGDLVRVHIFRRPSSGRPRPARYLTGASSQTKSAENRLPWKSLSLK